MNVQMPPQQTGQDLQGEDEPGMLAILPLILRRFGFTVTVAPNVPGALEELRNQVFDVLFCNLNVKRGGDGYKVIRAMLDVNPQCVTVIRRSGEPAVDGDDQLQRDVSLR